MRAVTTVTMLTILAPGGAQDLRLVDVLPRPLAYFSVAAAADRDPVLALFDDPALRGLAFGIFGAGAPDTDAAAASDSPSLQAWQRLRQVLEVTDGELELLLTALLPRGSGTALPLMIGRVELSATSGPAFRRTLADNTDSFEPLREIAGHRTYLLQGVSERRPGSLIELAVAGRQLLISNHGASMERALESLQPGTTATDAPVLAADPSYRALRERVASEAGTAVVYLDWHAVWRRLASRFDRVDRAVVDALGIDSVRHLIVSLRPTDDGLVSSVLVDQPAGMRGLLAATSPVSVRKLAQQLPIPGVASLTLSIDPRALAPQANRVAGFRTRLVGGCRDLGLDFASQVVPRLGRSGSCQLVLLDGERDGPTAGAVFSVRAKSRSAAQQLYRDVRRSLGAMQLGIEEHASEDRFDVVAPLRARINVGVVGDSLVVGMESGLVEELTARQKELGRRGMTRRRNGTLALLQKLDVRGKVIGILDFDFGRSATDGPNRGRHAGLLALEDDVVRIQMFTPR